MPYESLEHPRPAVTTNHVEAVGRRIHATASGRSVLTSDGVRYVWEWPYYPQYYVPLSDVDPDLLVDERHTEKRDQGLAHHHGVRTADGGVRSGAALVYRDEASPGLADTVRFEWDALDAWFEEDEQVFVHPRNPYVRVDALRSSKRVRVEIDAVLLAESACPVLVFETGLPTRYYFDRRSVDFTRLVSSDTQTPCPYKGVTSAYWSARVGDRTTPDLAWSYDFPTRNLLPVAGLVAFYNEKVDISVDGRRLVRPVTHFA